MMMVEEIFAEDRRNPSSERSLPWEETRGGVTVVVDPKPHWASDVRAFPPRAEFRFARDAIVLSGRGTISAACNTDLLKPAGGKAGGEGGGTCDGCRLPVGDMAPPPLPFANLGLIRLFVNQPRRGRLTRACRPRGFGLARTREGDCRSGQTLRAPVARGMVPRLQTGAGTRCPMQMPPPSPPASPPR